MDNNETGATPQSPLPPQQHGCRRWRGSRFLLVGGLLLAGIGVGTVAGKAFGPGPFGHHHGPWGGGLMQVAAPGGAIDPVMAEDRAVRMSKHFGVEVDATAEQQDKLTSIARAAVKDILPLRETMVKARTAAVDLLTAPAIDGAAVEKLRAEQMAVAERVTKRISEALVATAEVLTPEQRKKLADRVEQFRSHRGWGFWHRG